MSSDHRLDELAKGLDKTLDRIKELEKKPTLGTRLSSHFRSQGGNILNVVLAGCVLSVAVGRLLQQREHEAEVNKLRQEREAVEARNESLQHRVLELEGYHQTLRTQINRELDSGIWRLGPVAARIRQHLTRHVVEPATEAPVIQEPPRATQGNKQPKVMI